MKYIILYHLNVVHFCQGLLFSVFFKKLIPLFVFAYMLTFSQYVVIICYFFLAKDSFEITCEPFLMLEPPNEDDYNYCLDSEEGLGDLFGFRI